MRGDNFPSVLSYIESMEILMLILLYYLSRNPDFPESMRPLMGQLKNSEEMLKFLDDLSRFSELFSAFSEKSDGRGKPGKDEKKQPPPPPEEKNEKGAEKKENGAPSASSGIADKFIEECLERYFKKH